MARKLRIEAEGGVYHVLNRGNYRADIFAEEGARQAFLECLDEACGKTGWRVHAWCVMSNHYHLALETPEPNLVDGMQWLQATFSTRFNRFRQESGHVFQGRYKALIVEPGHALGALCHYIHLNPVRARILPMEALGNWPWCSFRWLQQPRERKAWFAVNAALEDAGELADTPTGRRRYGEYLAWLSAESAEQKRRGFERMSQGWALGSSHFKKELLKEEKHRAAALEVGAEETEEARELAWAEELQRLRKACGAESREDMGKSADWKVAVATVMKDRTTASNRWLAEQLGMGSLFTLSRLTSECRAGKRASNWYQTLTARSKA